MASLFKPGTTNDDLRKFSKIIVHGGEPNVIQPNPEALQDTLGLAFDDDHVIDYDREPLVLDLSECNITHDMPDPRVDRTLDKELYADLIKLIYETANTDLWAHATFRSYYKMTLAQRYLLNHFREDRNRKITTRAVANGNHLYVRLV